MNILALLPLLSTAFSGTATPDALPQMPRSGEEIAVMETSQGRIVLMFYPQTAPNHVQNFKALAKKGFYDGTRFHRVIPGFMIQGGDPNSKDLARANRWGTGGNVDADGRAVNVKAEFSNLKHSRGVLSMARSQNPDSASSQFFIMHADAPHLDGQYSAFGQVIEGIEVVDKIADLSSGEANGSVAPGDAVVLVSVRIEKWQTEKKEKAKKRAWSINGWDGRG